jgi:dihydroxyacetone kinase
MTDQEQQMHKIINDPDDFVDEVVDGILRAHPDRLRTVGTDRRALVRADAGTGRRVGIVTGGGSGHLPLFLGYVGTGLASGVAIGNVFSSPSPEQVHTATVASDEGAGVLYLYGNYGGDVYTFDLAAELAAADGIATTTVVGTDDILSAPADRADTRRGVAGLFFAFKTAGAAAERGDDLATVTTIARRTCEATRTMGVGLSPTILPTTGEPSFALDEGEMEIGIGIHGEPGRHRGPLESADRITDRFLAELLTEVPAGKGDEVAVLVNGLGATPLEELYLVFRRIHQELTARGVRLAHVFIGEYATSLEMAGASVSLLPLDAELSELLAAPADSPFYEQAAGLRGPASTGDPMAGTAPADGAPAAGRPATRPVEVLDHEDPLRGVLLEVAARLPAHAEELRELDAAIGDGDLGITVSSGAQAVGAALTELPEKAAPAEVLRAAGTAFASANPSTFAALLGGGMLGAAAAVGPTTGTERARTILTAMIDRIGERGGAEIGDKTVLDVLDAAARTLDDAEQAAGPAATARAARDAAARAVEESASRPNLKGRAAWLGDRSAGHRDPGQVAALRFLDELVASLDTASPSTP